MDTFVENNFPNLVSLIYEAALDHTRWQAFLDQLPAAFDGARGILRVCDNSATPPAALLFNCDPDYIRSYATYFHTLNPYSDEHARALAVGEVSFVSRFVPQADVEKSTYYHEWLRPQGITGNHLTCSLFRSLGTVATLGLAPHEASYRKDPYRYATRLRHLVPHMVRAVAVNHLLANVRRAEHALGSSLDALGAAAFVLEASGQLLHVNGLAEAMLRAADVIACKADGSLVAKNAADEPALEAAIHGAAAPGAQIGPPVRLTSRGTSALYLAWIMRMRDTQAAQCGTLRVLDGLDRQGSILVLVSRTDRKIEISADVLLAAFDLSLAEARLVAALAGGESPADYANRLGLSRNTVRNQMASIFDKTDTSRQAELVARVLATVGPFAGHGRH